MGGTFPTMRSGNTVFYPVQETRSFGTGVHRFMDDSEQRWRSRLMLAKYDLRFNDLNGYDTCKVRDFFRSQFGRFDSTWSFPFNGTTYTNMAFDQDEFPVQEVKRNHNTFTLRLIQVKSQAPTIPAAGSAYFPQINAAGVMTGLPYASKMEYRNVVDRLESGKQYAYKWRANPLGYFEINLPALRDPELVIVRDHFYAMEGRLHAFKFLDPGGSLINHSDDFSHASWTRSNVTVGAAVTDPFGGMLAKSVTATGVADLYTTVLPDNDAAGFVVCCSAWVRATGVGQTVTIGFSDFDLVTLGQTVWDLPQNQWVRVRHTLTLGSDFIRVFVHWSSSVIQLFSVQCSPMPMPGPRLLTPGADCLRPKCRYDTDDFANTYVQNNYTSVVLPVREYS